MFDEVADIRRTREEAANQRAGLIASEIVNWSGLRRKGARKIIPQDYFTSQDDYLSPDEAAVFLDRWTRTQNSRSEQ